MNRDTELALIQRCIEKHRGKTTTSGDQGTLDTARYTSASRFEREMDAIFRTLPPAPVHGADVREANSFRRVGSPLGELLVTRDASGLAHVFYNTCRHRGSTLVLAERGRGERLTCPYHAWSYTSDGALASVPAESRCFPGLDRSSLGLVEIPSVEKHGFIWVCPGAHSGAAAEEVLDEHLGDLAADLAWMRLDRLSPCKSVTRTWEANWKILTEGGMETYHFAIAHRDTIAPHFLNNTVVSDRLSGHFRATMPTRRIEDIAALAPRERQIRQCTHINYTIFPGPGLLVQKNHVDWFTFLPLSAGRTRVTITSLVPDDVAGLSDRQDEHWERNMEITDTTLQEDFRIGEGQQRSFESGAIDRVNLGRNEWALKAFNDRVDACCGSAALRSVEEHR